MLFLSLVCILFIAQAMYTERTLWTCAMKLWTHYCTKHLFQRLSASRNVFWWMRASWKNWTFRALKCLSGQRNFAPVFTISLIRVIFSPIINRTTPGFLLIWKINLCDHTHSCNGPETAEISLFLRISDDFRADTGLRETQFITLTGLKITDVNWAIFINLTHIFGGRKSLCFSYREWKGTWLKFLALLIFFADTFLRCKQWWVANMWYGAAHVTANVTIFLGSYFSTFVGKTKIFFGIFGCL